MNKMLMMVAVLALSGCVVQGSGHHKKQTACDKLYNGTLAKIGFNLHPSHKKVSKTLTEVAEEQDNHSEGAFDCAVNRLEKFYFKGDE